MRSRRLRLAAAVAVPLVLVAVVAVLLVAGRGDDKQPQAGTASPSATTPPATASPTTSTAADTSSVQPPNPANRGDDPQAAFRGIVATFNWLSWHPRAQPDVLGQIYEPSCPCYGRVLSDQRRLVSRGWRYATQDKGLQIVSLRTFSRRGPDVATLAVVDRQGKQIIVDQTDKVVSTGSGWSPTPRLYTLHRGTDGRWRVTGILTGGTG